jgi:hypothetical protein
LINSLKKLVEDAELNGIDLGMIVKEKIQKEKKGK